MKPAPKTKPPQPKLTVHPAADVFPMLPEDELNELAESIKANGLRESIKVKDGVLVDGRNRLKACELAGVEPKFEELNGGIDIRAYLISANINRRHHGSLARQSPGPYPTGGGGTDDQTGGVRGTS